MTINHLLSMDMEKCGLMVAKRSKAVRIEGHDTPEGRIPDMQDYKHLVIPQANRNDSEAQANTSRR